MGFEYGKSALCFCKCGLFFLLSPLPLVFILGIKTFVGNGLRFKKDLKMKFPFAWLTAFAGTKALQVEKIPPEDSISVGISLAQG